MDEIKMKEKCTFYTYLLCFQKSYKTVLPISAVSKAKNKIKKNSTHLRFKHKINCCIDAAKMNGKEILRI